MKVVISSGIGKLHFHETARAAVLGGVDVQFVAGWIPSREQARLVNTLGKLIGEKSLASRMEARRVDHPHLTMRSNGLAEFAGQAMIRLFGRVVSKGTLGGLAFAMAGMGSRKWLHDADIFHVRSGAGQGGAIRTARKNGMRILTDHSIAHPVYMEDVLRREYQRLEIKFERIASNGLWSRVQRDCMEADCLLVNSDFVKRTFIEKGYSPDDIEVAYLGVRERFFSIKKDYSIKGPVQILFTGNFDIRKGVATLLEAVRTLRRGGLDVHLRLIGNMANGRVCLRETDSQFFTHTPFIPPESLIPALAEADLFVFPTLIEGSSRSAMEAAAAGLPIITTENCGLPLEGEKEVIYVPLSDHDALTKAISRLASDEILRSEIGRNAAKRIQKNYRWTDYSAELIRVYGTLMANQESRPAYGFNPRSAT